MSASNPKTNIPDTTPTTMPEVQTKRIAEPVYVHAVSWRWLVAGLVCVLGIGGIAGAAYYFQARDMPNRIVGVVQRMVEEAEQERDKIELTDDFAEKERLMRRSVQLRNDAANLLNNYWQANPEEAGEPVLGKLYDILESLYRDHGGGATAVGRQRGEQLSRLATNLIRIVDEDRSIPYRTRLLELAWDRRNFNDFDDIITHGKSLLGVAQLLGLPENYEAIRYIAMAFFDWLPVRYYDPTAHQLPPPPVFPETMDGLLEKLNSQRPDDIEIAKRYAEFLVSVEREGRANFTASASEQLLRGKSEADRLALARDRIDVMVQLNENDPAAYLARYHFTAQFVPSGESQDFASSDLKRVLELAPGSAEGLILSGLHAIRQARIATQSGEPTVARNWHNSAEEYLRRTVKENPGDPLGYQYLGEYLLLIDENPRETIDVWNEGLKNSGIRSGNEELIGRLVMLLLQQGMVEEARARLEDLARTIDEMRVSRPGDVRRTQEMWQLLRARMYQTEAIVALSRVEAAERENRFEDARRLRGMAQQRRGDAVQRFEAVLIDFGTYEEHYIVERRSIYYSLLPQSLLQLAQLKLDTGQPDRAAVYYRRASRFTEVLRPALLGMSVAYQQSNRLDQATEVLREAARLFPDDLPIRYTYTMVSFRSQVTSNTVTPAALDTVQRELESLESFRNELPQPWALDIRLIHLGVARASLSNNAETILEAMNAAARQFRALERQSFPPDAMGNVRNYIDDPAFVAELVGIYSSLVERADFDRLLEVLRAFPDGEDAYYEARINDALRRDSRNEAIEIIDEAVESPRLSHARRDQFAGLLQNLRGGNLDNVSVFDNVYNQLKTTFDENPESLRPQAFFMLAEMSLDKGDIERAQQIKERLERIEGPRGTSWRYIEIRLMLTEEDPDFARMRELQEQIVRYRDEWDRSYILSTLIEERYLSLNPGDTAVRERLVTAYRNAIRCGNSQPEVWNRLIEHLEGLGRSEDARLVLRDAALRNVMLDSRTGQLPQPYGRMYSRVQEAIANEDAAGADAIARECIMLAERQGGSSELIFILHLQLGKVFLDALMYDSAIRHLSETARRGGRFIYPLALCVARSGDIDGGFALLLDEIDLMPSAMPVLLPAVLVLLAQVQPSEAIYERIDSLMYRIERGERLTLRGTIAPSDKDHVIPIGTRWVDFRRIMSLVVRFPENTDALDASIQFFTPEEYERWLDAEELAETEEPQ